jgi:acyl-CoA thioester hydrolase
MEVRDSEIDIQGIVNNANYMVYLEHARHKWLKEIGINFIEWSHKNLQLVLLSASLEFKKSLVAGNKFYVTCKAGELVSLAKFSINQEIYLIHTGVSYT